MDDVESSNAAPNVRPKPLGLCGRNYEHHIWEMKQITDRLAAMGSPISVEDRVMTLLGSLPSSYGPLVTTLGSLA